MKTTSLLAIISVLSPFVPLLAEGPAQQQSQVANTQRIAFASGGTIRLNGSFDDLYIEGWDHPEVEITVIKSTHYSKPPVPARKSQRLEALNVTADRPSAKELAISTSPHGKRAVSMDYRIHVPRDSQLVIHHRGGSVTIGNVTGGVDAANRDGDILVMLPANGSYSINARSKMGHIASDFDGRTLNRFLVGQRFIRTSRSPSRRIRLTVGFGGITILALPPEGEALSSASSE